MKARSAVLHGQILYLLITATPSLVRATPAAQHAEQENRSPASIAIHPAFEGEFNLHLGSQVNDQIVYGEVRVGFPRIHTWIGLGLGAISSLGAHDQPANFGLVTAASLIMEPHPFQLVVRGYFDRVFFPEAQLIRLEARLMTSWKVSPIMRAVADYTPLGWNTQRPREEYWEGILSGGASVQLTRGLTLSALVGISFGEHDHTDGVATLHMEWQPF